MTEYQAQFAEVGPGPFAIQHKKLVITLSVLPVGMIGTARQDQSTQLLRVLVSVSRSLLACHDWPLLTDDDLFKVAFERTKEMLQVDGIPFGDTVELSLNENDRELAQGQPYTLDNIDVMRPFTIPMYKEKIGFHA